MKLSPTGNHVIVEKMKHEVSKSILWTPALDEANYGGPKLFRVLATGPGRRNRKGLCIPVECAAGDRVLCQSYFTGPADMGDGRFCITDDQILAVLPHL